MKKYKNKLAGVVLFLLMADSHAFSQGELEGEWCFYEQSTNGSKISEKVSITLQPNNQYIWQEGAFKQDGEWGVDNNELLMADVGIHKIISIEGKELRLKRYSMMSLRKGECSDKTFSDQDITGFHNAAATNEPEVIKEYLSKGISVDITDFRRKDTALIKSAKFCRVNIAEILIENKANKSLKNSDGKTALDYAKESHFHQGCDSLVKLLQ